MLTSLLTTILPENPQLGMPCAKAKRITDFFTQQQLLFTLQVFLQQLENTSLTQFENSFEMLTIDQKFDILKQVQLRYAKLSKLVMVNILKSYYTDEVVLHQLKVEAIPPFPKGQSLDDTDWTLLAPVYEKGFHTRKVDEQ